MFSVVKFVRSDEVEMVSTNWLCDTEDGKFCFWPKHLKSQHRKKILLEARKPELSWVPIKVSILGTYDNYYKAKQKLRLAETPSNIKTENGQQPAKKQCSNQKEPDRPTDPQTNQRKPENSRSLQLLPQLDCRLIKQEPQDSEQPSDNICNSSRNNYATKKCCVVLSNISATLDELFRAVQELKQQQDAITLMLQRLLAYFQQQPESDSAVYNEIVVVNTLEELRKMDMQLQDQLRFALKVKCYGMLGGKDVKEVTRIILKNSISHSLSLQLGWTKTESKTSIQDFSNFVLFVSATVRRNSNCCAASQKEINSAMRCWLRNAPDRNGGRNKR